MFITGPLASEIVTFSRRLISNVSVTTGRGQGKQPWEDMMTKRLYHANSSHSSLCVWALMLFPFYSKRTLGLMVMVSQRFPSLFPVLSYTLAAKEHSPLRQQTGYVSIGYTGHRVNITMPQAISNTSFAVSHCSKN